MKCRHGIDYPAEGPNGPWDCNPDGSNPKCEECEGDSWASEVYSEDGSRKGRVVH